MGDGDGGNEEPVEKEEPPVGNEEGSEDRKESSQGTGGSGANA